MTKHLEAILKNPALIFITACLGWGNECCEDVHTAHYWQIYGLLNSQKFGDPMDISCFRPIVSIFEESQNVKTLNKYF